MYSEDDEELELKENIEEGIDLNLEELNKAMAAEEEAVVDEEELSGDFIEEDFDEDIMEDEDIMIEESEIFDNELATDNMMDENDIIDE